MGWVVPDTQVAPNFTGTFVLNDDDGAILGAVPGINAGPWMRFSITGSTGFLGDGPGRVPLGTYGVASASLNYLRGSIWRTITGCYADFTAEVKRDYLVFFGVRWLWYNIGRKQMQFRILVNGSATGILPNAASTPWEDTDTNFPGTSERFVRSMQFLLKNWEPGTYRVQAQWYNLNQAVDQTLEGAYIVVM